MLWTAHKIALFPTPVRVCGLNLYPPTVGRFMVLEHLESPYTCGGSALPFDLWTAVAICAVPHWLGIWIVKHRLALALAQGVVSLFMRLTRGTWAKESATFGRWLKECSWMPERFKEQGEKSGNNPCTPYSYRLAYMLLDRFTEREISRMPLPKAHLYVLARAESGGSQFETLDEYQANGLPEGYAYHPKDFPEIDKTLHPEEYEETAQ